MSILTRIQENENHFTSTDRQIVDYILKYPNEAVLMSAKELGEVSDTSPSAVIRLMKKLNYSNLNEVRSELSKADINKPDIEKDLIINPDDSLKVLSQKVTYLIMDVVQKTMELVNFNSLQYAVDKLRSAQKIYLYGIGASALVADDFHQKMLRIKGNCIFHTDSHVQIGTAVNTTHNDAVIAFSYSGNTKEVLTAVEKAKENGAYCIAVTKAQPSPLSAFADFICTVPSIEKEIRLGAIGSRYAELIISDILYMSIAQNDFELTERYILESRLLINKLRD